MAIGVVPLVIVVALLHLVVVRAQRFHCPAHFDSDGALLRSRLVVVDKVDGQRLWKEEWISAYHGGQQGRLISSASSERVGVVLGLGLMAMPLKHFHPQASVSCSNLLKTRSTNHLI